MHPPSSLQFGQSGAAIAEELTAGGLSVPLVQVDKMRDAVNVARTLALPGELSHKDSLYPTIVGGFMGHKLIRSTSRTHHTLYILEIVWILVVKLQD